MTSLAFDTHALVKQLTQAGMPEQQAEVLADQQKQLLEEQLASKQDIAEVKRDIKESEIALKRDITELETALKRDIKELDVKIEAFKTELKRDIKELESTLTIKLGGMLVVGISVIAVLIKIL